MRTAASAAQVAAASGSGQARVPADSQIAARPGLTRPPVPALSATPRLLVQRCGAGPCDCAEAHEEGYLRRKTAESAAPQSADVPAAVHDVLRSHGTPLSTDVRAFFESRFGQDFSLVRVHADARAAASARALGARAYTVGNDIALSGDAPRMPTAAGGKLLAHELAHVVQQRGGVSAQAKLTVGEADSPAEHEADFAAEQVMRDPAGPSMPDESATVGQVALTSSPGYAPGRRALIQRGAAAHVVQRSPDDYQRGHDDGSNCQGSHPGPLLPDGLKDYDRGYNEGVKNCVLASGPSAQCATPYKKATSFRELIDLVRAAESKLSAAGIATPKDQIHALRGIYYGTTWSHDYAVETSVTRNEGFQRFTRPSMDPAKSVPSDVRSVLDCHLFEALQESQDMVDPGGRQIDFGHLIIGLDARSDPSFSSNISYPVPLPMGMGTYGVPLGGTGTELVTWLGDLGGGAANLAIQRVSAPGTSASAVFTGSDYGGSINLEGDVAASVVATASPSTLTAPDIKPGKRLSDALADFLLPSASGTAWKDRASTFLSINGGIFDASGALTNRTALISAFTAKIRTFACNYLASRVKDKHVTLNVATGAGKHINGAAQEVATAFIDALDDSHKSGSQIAAKRFPAATPAGSQACTTQLAAGAAGGLLGM